MPFDSSFRTQQHIRKKITNMHTDCFELKLRIFGTLFRSLTSSQRSYFIHSHCERILYIYNTVFMTIFKAPFFSLYSTTKFANFPHIIIFDRRIYTGISMSNCFFLCHVSVLSGSQDDVLSLSHYERVYS